MTVVISDALVLGGLEFDTDNPIVGWRNLVTAPRLSTQTAVDSDHPLSNLANPSTYLRFQQANAGEDFDIIFEMPGASEEIDYVGIARHNWAGRTVRVYGALNVADYALMLHLDGVDGSQVFADSSNNTKVTTSNGGAAVDTAQSKFGGGSALFAGTGMSIAVEYHQNFDFGANNFTMDCWFNCELATGVLGIIAQLDGVWDLFRTTLDKIHFNISTTDGTFNVTSTTSFNNGLNTGWHHVAAVRNGSLLMLFIDGVLEASGVVTGAALVPSPSPFLTIGGDTGYWNGRLEEFRITNGFAQWTVDFLVPTQAYVAFGENQMLPLVQPTIPANNTPLVIRFEPGFYLGIEVVAEAPASDTEAGYAAVLYVGKLLVIQRKLQVSFTPITMGRRSEIIGQRSERGQFLGRSIVGAWLESNANIRFMTAEWYREHMDEFIEASETTPFFFAWAPVSYPTEVGFAWAMEIPQPEIFDPSELIGVTIQMQGIAS